MQNSFASAVVLGLLMATCQPTAPSVAEEPQRHLGPHEHGHGFLNIAIEGNTVSMQLEAPGADVGVSESSADTPEAKAAMASAMSALEQPLVLFGIPAAAGCKQATVNVAIKPDDDDDDDHAPPEVRKPGEPKIDPVKPDATASDKAPEHHGHADLHAEYVLTCATVTALSSLKLAYFTTFTKAQKLTVQIVTPVGQSQFEASAAVPTVSLAALQ